MLVGGVDDGAGGGRGGVPGSSSLSWVFAA